jgi:hypothetical protein
MPKRLRTRISAAAPALSRESSTLAHSNECRHRPQRRNRLSLSVRMTLRTAAESTGAVPTRAVPRTRRRTRQAGLVSLCLVVLARRKANLWHHARQVRDKAVGVKVVAACEEAERSIQRDMMAVRVSPDQRRVVVGSPKYFASHPSRIHHTTSRITDASIERRLRRSLSLRVQEGATASSSM